MNAACVRARRRRLLSEDGTAGWLSRLLLDRHLQKCPACREFSENLGYVTERLAPAILEAPSEDASRRLAQLGRDRLARAVEEARYRELRRRMRQSLLGGFAGAAAVLLLYSANPFSGIRPAEYFPPLGVTLQESLRDTDASNGSVPATFDERLEGLEKKLKCLDTVIDDFNWNSLEGGDPCADA